MVVHRIVRPLLAAVVGVLCFSYAMADEGMWTFDNPPRKQLKELYGFEPTKEWLEHIRLSSVRFNDGGSGAFVSADGLVITNHHVARGQLQKMSSQQKNYVADGFYARTYAEELKATDLELNVLVGMEDVTARVLAAVKPGMSAKEALDARKAASAAISKESKEKTGLRADVVPLYQGGEYWLHTYKQYTDVRLVMAPEEQIAFYGGDADNFTFPRYDLDMAFFRVYENGKPVKVQHFFKWNANGAADGELVFVSGHPGSTNRLQTYAQTEYQRDVAYPMTLKMLKRRLAVLYSYSARGAEQARQARGSIFGLENSQKAMTGEFGGLNDRETMAKKAAEEKDFRERVMANPAWKEKYGWAWDSVSAAVERSRALAGTRSFRSVRSRLLSFAIQLVQYVDEIKKPNGERLGAFQDANLEGTKFRLFSPAPVYLDLDEEQCIDGLRESLEALGPNDPYLKAVLRGKTPEALAKDLVRGSKLVDPAVRRQLFEGGEKAINASDDPAIVLARIIEPMNRETRTWEEKNIAGPLAKASEKIGEARFAVYGKSAYPDATFTLRLSYGTVKGYPMNGTVAPSRTTLFGLYDRAYSFDRKGAFDVPQRYLDRIGTLDLKTPVNFVSTCDIIGGNSGSPVINKNGEYVGLIFDGNIESLPGRFLYSDKANRAVSVHSAYIIHTLRKLYDAAPLADELEAK
jgi:hypothetical protein